MKKTWRIPILTLGLLIAGLSLFFWSNSEKSAPYDLVAVKKGDITFSVTADGIVEPNFEVEIKSRASGDIISLPHETGDVVKKGDLLVRLDPIDEQRNVGQKEATLRADEANLAKAKANVVDAENKFKRQKELFERGMISDEELETAKTDYLLARAEVEYAQAQVAKSKVAVDDAKRRLADTEIRAPIDGVIMTKDVEVGQVIASTIDVVGGGTKLMTLADLSRIFVVASIDETDIGKVRLGQRVLVVVDAYLGKKFDGKVVHIAPQGTLEENVVTFEVKIEIEGEEKQLLRPAMTADVQIIHLKKGNTLWLPNEAIVDLPTENQDTSIRKGVFRWTNGKVELTPVTCGVTDGIITEIIEGVSEEDKVVAHASFVSGQELGKESKIQMQRFMRKVGR